MKRFHVHVTVEDLAQSIRFYSTLFATEPTVLKPVLTLGAGTFHTSVNGEANAPYRGLHQADWSFAADAGVGLVVHLGARLELAVEGHALWAAPEPIVRFVSEDAAHVGHPGVVGTYPLAA